MTGKEYAEINNSTMNRICKAFDDIGNINMNFAGIAQFNWQMLLREPCNTSRPEIPLLFCDLDGRNISNEILSLNMQYSSERQLVDGTSIAAEDIERIMVEKYGSLEAVYPYIVKYLFGGEGMNRSAHKQMFWKVFGNIALQILKENLKTCDTCEKCFMRIPAWVTMHTCMTNTQGFMECIDCGKIFERTNSRQYRCEYCQEKHKRLQKQIRSKKYRNEIKEQEDQRIMRLRSS